VLKVALHHRVSVITNFVIPKRDKKNKQTRNQYASPPRGNAIPAGAVQYPWSDCDEIFVVKEFLLFPRFVQISI